MSPAEHTDPETEARLVSGLEASGVLRAPDPSSDDEALGPLIRENAEPLQDIESDALDVLLDRIGDARVVLLGESTHGTREFYRMRARISRELILRRGFDFIAVEADWPDAMRVNRYIADAPPSSQVDFTPFSRFPAWMWRNEEVSELVEWLRAYNRARSSGRRPEPSGARGARPHTAFYGLDLYSMFTSIAHVLHYLDSIDPSAARLARTRYGALTPWQRDPAAYGAAVLVGRSASSEAGVVAMLRDLLERRLEYAKRDGERFFDAAQNARVIMSAERYYRAMYHRSAESWNLRDRHMFETLLALLAFHGPDARGIVWEHNSHLGDARATEMGVRGELNVGQLCRENLDDQVYAIGFGTHHGTVAAAPGWGEAMETMRVRPAVLGSYERIFHDSDVPAFLLHLRDPRARAVREELVPPRLQRAIGVVYRPETELSSHYFYASLPRQFDEFVWFDETRAVSPLPVEPQPERELPDTYPLGV